MDRPLSPPARFSWPAALADARRAQGTLVHKKKAHPDRQSAIHTVGAPTATRPKTKVIGGNVKYPFVSGLI